jgi:hypothetical protein
MFSDNRSEAYDRFEKLVASWNDHSNDESGKEKIVRWALLWAVHQQVYYLSYAEELANRKFVDWCKHYLKSNKTDEQIRSENETDGQMIWESVIMFQILTETNNLVRIIDNCIHICSE